MGIAPKDRELARLTDDELVARYDAEATNTVVGTSFYREELARRQLTRESARMLEMTKTMRNLTWAIFFLTVVNVIVATFPLLNG